MRTVVTTTALVSCAGGVRRRLRRHEAVAVHAHAERVAVAGVVHADAAGHAEPGADRQDGGVRDGRHLQLGPRRADLRGAAHDDAHGLHAPAHVDQGAAVGHEGAQPRAAVLGAGAGGRAAPGVRGAAARRLVQPVRRHHQAGGVADQAAAGAAERAHGGAGGGRHEGHGRHAARRRGQAGRAGQLARRRPPVGLVELAARAAAGHARRAHDDAGHPHGGQDAARRRQVHDPERGGRDPHVRLHHERARHVRHQHGQHPQHGERLRPGRGAARRAGRRGAAGRHVAGRVAGRHAGRVAGRVAGGVAGRVAGDDGARAGPHRHERPGPAVLHQPQHLRPG